MHVPFPPNCHWQPLALAVQGSVVQAQFVPDVKAAKPEQRVKTLKIDLATAECTVSNSDRTQTSAGHYARP
jgi:hypothetical protein